MQSVMHDHSAQYMCPAGAFGLGESCRCTEGYSGIAAACRHTVSPACAAEDTGPVPIASTALHAQTLYDDQDAQFAHAHLDYCCLPFYSLFTSYRCLASAGGGTDTSAHFRGCYSVSRAGFWTKQTCQCTNHSCLS